MITEEQLEKWEDIITEWKTLEEAKNLCLDWSIKEDRVSEFY